MLLPSMTARELQKRDFQVFLESLKSSPFLRYSRYLGQVQELYWGPVIYSNSI